MFVLAVMAIFCVLLGVQQSKEEGFGDDNDNLYSCCGMFDDFIMRVIFIGQLVEDQKIKRGG